MEQENGVGAGQTGAVGGANPMGVEQVVAEQVTVAQVEPAESAEPVTPVEPVAPGSMVAEPKASKKGRGMVIGLIFCLLLAAGGVGFGVWAWMDGNSQKDALNSQITSLKKQNNDLRDEVSELNKKITELESNKTTPDDESAVEGTEYINVSEWGYKIKIPEELKIVNQQYSEGEDGSSSICVWGYSKKDGSESPSFVESSDPIACISKYPESTNASGALVFAENGYNYLFNSAQSYLSEESDVAGKEWEDETRTLMSQSLGQQGNYVKL